MLLSQSYYYSRIVRQLSMKMAKTASILMVGNMKTLFLEPVSSEAKQKEKKEILY